MIMELLGIDDKDRDEFQRLSAERFDFVDGAAKSLDIIQESIEYLLRGRRAATGRRPVRDSSARSWPSTATTSATSSSPGSPTAC